MLEIRVSNDHLRIHQFATSRLERKLGTRLGDVIQRTPRFHKEIIAFAERDHHPLHPHALSANELSAFVVGVISQSLQDFTIVNIVAGVPLVEKRTQRGKRQDSLRYSVKFYLKKPTGEMFSVSYDIDYDTLFGQLTSIIVTL